MIVKTKKYQLEKGVYIKKCMKNALLSFWWAFLIPIALITVTAVTSQIGWAIGGVVAAILFVLFWYIQFAGVSQLDQFKMIFDSYVYEIDSRQIMMKVDSKRGMPLKWEQIKKASADKNGITMFLSRAHMVYLPKRLFKTDNDIKFVESIMKRKSLLK